jgi:outer membrane phospholipase A
MSSKQLFFSLICVLCAHGYSARSEVNKQEFFFEQQLEVSPFSILESNYLNFSNDAYEDSISDEEYVFYVAFKISIKIPIFEGVFSKILIANSVIQPYIGYTGEFDSHTNRPSSPVVSMRQNPSVFIDYIKLKKRRGSNWFSKNSIGFAHESNGQDLREGGHIDSTVIAHDKISIGWNYMIFKSEIWSIYTQNWMFSTNLWNRHYPRARDTDDTFSMFSQSKGADFRSYRSFKIELLTSYRLKEGLALNLKTETWLGHPGYNHFDWENTNNRVELAIENSYIPFYVGVNFGTSKYLANYWEHNKITVYEVGLSVDELVWGSSD